LNEVVWLHRSSGTLILTDLCVRIEDTAPFATRAVARLLGVRNLSMSRTMKLLIRDRAALRDSVAAIRQWRFDRVIVAHEGVIESGGAAAFSAAMRWLDG
jgi:hypothetical protein